MNEKTALQDVAVAHIFVLRFMLIPISSDSLHWTYPSHLANELSVPHNVLQVRSEKLSSASNEGW